MSTAYSYVRWSSDKQTSGDSLRRQSDAAIQYAAKHRLALSETTFKDPAMSGYRGRNVTGGALGVFLKACDGGAIKSGDLLLVESLDRLSRTPVQTALKLFQDIVDRGITLVTLMDGQRYSTDSINQNWTQLIIALAVMAKAHAESSEKGRRVKEAWDTKRKAGGILTAMGPSWLKLNDKRHWELVPDKVATVRRIFKLAETHGSLKIARMLHDEGVPTLGTAKKWDPALVLHVLRNPAVTGMLTGKKAKADPDPKYYPPIIKAKAFAEVQERIAARKGSGGPTGEAVSNLFTGLLRCECGQKLKYVSSNKAHLYLQCVDSYMRTKACDAPTMPYNAVENILLSVLETAEIAEAAEEISDARTDLDDRIAKLQTLLDAMTTAIGDRNPAELPTLIERMAKIESEKAALMDKRRGVLAPTPVSEAHERARTLGRKLLKTAKPSDLLSLRARMRAEFGLLFTKITLLKRTHSSIDALISQADGDEDLIAEYEEMRASDDQEFRELLLEGPFVEAFNKTWKHKPGTPLKLDYNLQRIGFGRKRIVRG